MNHKFKEDKNLNLTEITTEMLEFWKQNNIFQKSVSNRENCSSFTFFEGPPSANGLPGIHHVMARTVKDLFCRYKTQKGFQVNRKAGWDTHGLPVELGVEKELNITKEDIGSKISIEEYNIACKKAVMKYTNVWNDLTEKMGYWVDMENPYVTYTPKYIESVWWLLKQIYNKNLLFKGYTIQPYSPKAGTGLSSHELNQPGCYKNVKDTTVVALFKALPNSKLPENTYFLAWTTTPWTLPSNTALCIGKNIEYVLIKTFNQYTELPVNIVLAKDLIDKQLSGKYTIVDSENELSIFNDSKKIPFFIAQTFNGSELVGLKYEQLLPYALPFENAEFAFQVISGDFVTTSEGTGIVHIAPTFGSDDAKVAKESGIPAMLVLDEHNKPVPLVDLQGKFRPEMKEFAGKYVKNEYYNANEEPEKSVDVEIAILLKEQNKAFKVEKYEHSYPHCWRTDKPVLYYPLDSWFIKVTEVKNNLIDLNNTINWKPKATGTGRFGNWLENANDWNLSRSRFWGVPIPIWRSKEGNEQLCIGSLEELMNEIEKSIQAGFMKENPLKSFKILDFSDENYNSIDLHKNIVDKIILVSSTGKPMFREPDLIDVWFDSGSMPYAQWHYPFENKELIDSNKQFPADFIAEGVDQTRGWFYTLHVIATICFNSVAYKNVLSNGLVLDKNGQKMSKRLGNAIDPFETLQKYSPDATRWYMITNAQPWDNLKFDLEGITEVSRKFFNTLQNTYSFFALYANLDGFTFNEPSIPLDDRTESDKWIISKLNSLIHNVTESLDDYEPTKAARSIQYFVTEDLSNWYVRLNRKRFWKGEYGQDKISCYQTLFECLLNISKLMAPFAPFYSEKLYKNLTSCSQFEEHESVHLTNFPTFENSCVLPELEERMNYAQTISSLIHSIRKKESIKVRQPLSKVIIPDIGNNFESKIELVKDLIKTETNIKDIEIIKDSSNSILVKKIKPNFATLGKKYGKQMKTITEFVSKLDQKDIENIEQNESVTFLIDSEELVFSNSDFIITSNDIPGWSVANEGKITVALETTITEELKQEGIAREIVNRVQNLRKNNGYDVQDKIEIFFDSEDNIVKNAFTKFADYISMETQAKNIKNQKLDDEFELEFDDIKLKLQII